MMVAPIKDLKSEIIFFFFKYIHELYEKKSKNTPDLKEIEVSIRTLMKEFRDTYNLEWNKTSQQRCGVLWNRIFSVLLQNKEAKRISFYVYRITNDPLSVLNKYKDIKIIRWDKTDKKWSWN